jgi:hypothetical protein
MVDPEAPKSPRPPYHQQIGELKSDQAQERAEEKLDKLSFPFIIIISFFKVKNIPSVSTDPTALAQERHCCC